MHIRSGSLRFHSETPASPKEHGQHVRLPYLPSFETQTSSAKRVRLDDVYRLDLLLGKRVPPPLAQWGRRSMPETAARPLVCGDLRF